MAVGREFSFCLYRLNLIDEDQPTFEFMGKRIEEDADIVSVLKNATLPDFDNTQEGKTSVYQWSLRDYLDLAPAQVSKDPFFRVTLSRSLLTREGEIVTDDGLAAGRSSAHPPLAEHIDLYFILERHLIAAEYRSSIHGSDTWRKQFRQIVRNSARALDFRTELLLEPVPTKHEILRAFESFERLTRMRVHLLIPNPDLSRFTKFLHDKMSDGSIREYVQDMRNPNGLNQERGELPFAAAAMAQDGYKKGNVELEGIRGGQRESVRTGEQAARGSLEFLREVVRAAFLNAKSKEAKKIGRFLKTEIDRLLADKDD